MYTNCMYTNYCSVVPTRLGDTEPRPRPRPRVKVRTRARSRPEHGGSGWFGVDTLLDSPWTHTTDYLLLTT